MSGAHGAWQYRTQQGLSEDGTTFWSKATMLPDGISVSRNFKRLGNVTDAELQSIRSAQASSGLMAAGAASGVAALLGGAYYAYKKLRPPKVPLAQQL
mmetsp:Transcript_24100/g.69303  ORF Transcript_24100/g.69303 Transcript_24100/m.69303 type:complete len:98 (+) Transcript_24100:764-1057(+)